MLIDRNSQQKSFALISPPPDIRRHAERIDTPPQTLSVNES
jgi:hypothetical protein